MSLEENRTSNIDEADGIGLLGSGGHADEVSAILGGSEKFRAVSFQYVGGVANVDIENPGSYIDTPVHAAVGAPAVRRELVSVWPGRHYATVVAPSAVIEQSSTLEDGCYVSHGAIITTNVRIGRHAVVNVGASVHHGCRVGDFTTISPGVHVGGNTTIGNGVFIGIGAAVSNGLQIADGVVIGAGAVLVANADTENGVYVGVPARLVSINEGWLGEI